MGAKLKEVKRHMKIDDFASLTAVYEEETHAAHLERKAETGERLTASKQTAFNTLRAKVRKGNKPFEAEVAKYKEDPSAFEDAEPEKEEESSDSDSEAGSGSGSKSSSSSNSGSDSSSSSDSDSDSDSDSSSSSSSGSGSKSYSSGSDSDKGGRDEDEVREKKMLRWLITDEVAAKIEKKEAEKKAALGTEREKKDKSAKTKKGKEAKVEKDEPKT